MRRKFGLPNPILIEDILRDLRQIIFQTCEDLRCMKEKHFHDTRTTAIMLAIHEQDKSATMEKLMELSQKYYLENRRNAFGVWIDEKDGELREETWLGRVDARLCENTFREGVSERTSPCGPRADAK